MRKEVSRLVLEPRDLGVAGVRMVGRYDYSAAEPGLLPHKHGGAIEICLLARGEQSYAVNGKEFRLRGGDQFVTLPGETHDTAGRPEEKGRLYWLILDLSTRGFLRLHPSDVVALRRALISLPCRQFPAHPDAISLLEDVIRLASSKRGDPLQPIRLSSVIVRYFLLTIDAAQAEARSSLNVRLRRCLQLIQDRVDEPLTISDLADFCRISLPRFKVWFRNATGTPPREYILRRKIDAACIKLRDGRDSVTDIAFSLGFSSSQYFATVFRRFMGCTPVSHRQSAVQRRG
ncbi:MAG: AraC family transcriptional regulator [Chthoniobacterales bacterium]